MLCYVKGKIEEDTWRSILTEESCFSGLAPFWRRSLTILRWPAADASWTGVQPAYLVYCSVFAKYHIIQKKWPFIIIQVDTHKHTHKEAK